MRRVRDKSQYMSRVRRNDVMDGVRNVLGNNYLWTPKNVIDPLNVSVQSGVLAVDPVSAGVTLQMPAYTVAKATALQTWTDLGDVAISSGTPAVITFGSHGLAYGDIVKFTTTGGLYSGITPFSPYRVLGQVLNPTMTSNSAPSPNVTSASSILNSAYDAYKATDNTTGEWATTTSQTEWWWKWYAGDTGVIAGAIGVMPGYGGYFTLQGSNDDSAWTDLTSGQLVYSGTACHFTFENSTAYKYYRMWFTSLNPSMSVAGIREIRLYGAIPANTFYIAPYLENTTDLASINTVNTSGSQSGTHRLWVKD